MSGVPCKTALPFVGLLFASIFSVLSQPVAGATFLARLPEHELRRALLSEIEAALGGSLHDVTKSRIGEIEDALKPTFQVLPKNEYGRLDHDGVRYLLNRFFAQQHGWFIKGLQSEGGTWNASESKLVMRDHLPEVLQSLFEQQLGHSGAELKEVVSFAAMIEHLIRDELKGRLELLYEAKGVRLEDNVDRQQALSIMEAYMICLLRGQETSACTAKLKVLERNFHKQYPAWTEVKNLIADVQRQNSREGQESFQFDEVVSALEVVADRFSGFYEGQCNKLKSALLNLEEKRSGRVPLADFYKAALYDGMYNFIESPEVLRSLGALDEVDGTRPRIIIPNYVGGLSNCVARTSFYSTCCPNTCESLLDRIERTLGKAEGTPEEIIEAVQAPGAALEKDFAGLSPWLERRLNDLAKHHNGKVPLHGRLFMQWLHFVHPQDCMYPHISGSTYKKSLEEWAREAGKNPQLSVQQLRNVTQQLVELRDQVSGETEAEMSQQHEDSVTTSTGMWTMEEELLVMRRPYAAQEEDELRQASGVRRWATKFATFVVLLMMFYKAGSLFLPGSQDPKARRIVKESIAKYNV